MLEVPKSTWERIAPFAVVGVVVAMIGGVALAAFLPKLDRPPAATRATSTAELTAASTIAEPQRRDTEKQNTWISWEAGKPTSSYHVGGFDFAFQAVVQDDLNAAKSLIENADGLVTEVTGQALSWNARADFAVVQLDESRPERQILFSSFSGGAHCCTSLVLLEVHDGAWRQIDLGRRDGDTSPLPEDLDGDGLKEFVLADQAFLYAFDSYAGSWPPSVVMAMQDGRMRDVSSQRRFRSVYQRDLVQSRDACAERGNGACAGYVATAARLGRLDEAWAFMLRSYYQTADWDYPVACRVRTAGQCPAAAELRFATFPEALQWFLGEQGYTAPSYVEPLNARGPSYSCGAARKASERVVCASSELASLDRLMARAYTRAMALTANRAALRASQREFLLARDESVDLYSLQTLYVDRIRELAAA